VLHTRGGKNINAVPNRRPARKKQKNREMSNKEQNERVKKMGEKKERQGRIPRGAKEELKQSWLPSGFISRVVW